MSKSKPSAAYLRSLKHRYHQANRTERGAILDEFVRASGHCHRKHASAVLRGRQQPHRGPIRRPRARNCQGEDRAAVLQITEWFDEISSHGLRAAMNATQAAAAAGSLKSGSWLPMSASAGTATRGSRSAEARSMASRVAWRPGSARLARKPAAKAAKSPGLRAGYSPV